MKVLMLNGSWNQDGSTKAGLDEMAKAFATEGVGTEIVTVGGKPIADCIACNKCSELKRCVFADDGVNDFAAKAKDADGFVFGSPVYYAHPSGRIQSFLDRLFFSTMRADAQPRGVFRRRAQNWTPSNRLERMTMNGYNKIDYAVNIVEAYRRAKGLSGEEVAKLFGDAGVFKFLEDFGDTLHCQGDEATIAEIDDFIKTPTP